MTRVCPTCDPYFHGDRDISWKVCPRHERLLERACCPKYYECFECDAVFCDHGNLGDVSYTVTVIPLTKMCPDCDSEDLHARGLK